MKNKKRRAFIIILISAAALIFGVAAFVCALDFAKTKQYHLSSEREFGISNLDDVVVTLRRSLKERSPEIGISFFLKGDHMGDIEPFVEELMELALEETGVPDEGDYLRFQMGGYTFTYNHLAKNAGYRYSIYIRPQYHTTALQEEQTTLKIREILDSLKLEADAKEYEKIRAVHDFLIQNVSYDKVHKKNEYHTIRSSAYGALINHSATCQGYCVAMYRMLSELGVSCRIITGEAGETGETEYHAWNIARMDGLYYNIDVTWDDETGSDDYFLKTDDLFTGHQRDEKFQTPDFYARYPMVDTMPELY